MTIALIGDAGPTLVRLADDVVQILRADVRLEDDDAVGLLDERLRPLIGDAHDSGLELGRAGRACRGESAKS